MDLYQHALTNSSMKKRFNVDSPTFTPSSSLAPNGGTPPPKSNMLSPRTANAAIFQPNRSITPASSVTSFSSTSAPKQYNPTAPDFVGSDHQEFLPQNYGSLGVDGGTDYSQNDVFSSGLEATGNAAIPTVEAQHSNYHYSSGINGGQHSSYIATSTNSSQMLQHHLYAPLDAYTHNAKPYKRTAKDIFIPEDLRQRLQKKTEASLRSFANSQLPNVEHFHTLTPLEPFSYRTPGSTAPQSTVLKAVSDEDGKTYSLRRIHDMHMLRESDAALAVQSLKTKWGRISNSSIVAVHVAFSTQSFGDSSIIIVSDYFPDSTTLRDKYPPASMRTTNRGFSPQIPEQTLWSYLVQAANALKTIHSLGLAARFLDAKRWLVTDEDRIRFNASCLADITDPVSTPVRELRKLDLHNLGKLIFNLGTVSMHNKMRPLEHFSRLYSARLKNVTEWLQHQSNPEADATIDDLLRMISTETLDAVDASLKLNDSLTATLTRELENARIVRLLFKLNAINERPEYENDPSWQDQGQKASVRLFRDYVFHQVDATGAPVMDMGHMIACLNKLDAGVEERIVLMGRDSAQSGQGGGSVLVVSYRELKVAIEGAWVELVRRGGSG